MEALIAEIVARTDRAIALALKRVNDDPSGARHKQYRLLATNLAGYKASLLAGTLAPPGSGAGRGAGRAISEWDLDDPELIAAVEQAEGLYRAGQ